MKVIKKTREQWKSDGDKLCKSQRFDQAISCYNKALRLATNQYECLDLFLDRCYSRVNCQHYDSALHDAEFVLNFSPTNERALLYKAKAIYGLRRFKDSADQLTKLLKLYPNNRDARFEFKRSLARLREQQGHYDFAAMLDEAIAKYPRPLMDRADYVGPIEARKCAVESHGRGFYSIRPVKAGELLLVEKAFFIQFPHPNENISFIGSGIPGRDPSDMPTPSPGDDIEASILKKLEYTPSLAPSFASLYPGHDFKPDFEDGNVVIDEKFVEARVKLNAFEVPVLSAKWQWRDVNKISSPENPKSETSNAVGVWIRGSMANHSCRPTISRSFIGDMMIWRANTDIAADTELKLGYKSSQIDYTERQEFFAGYGFVCECVLCLSQKNTPAEKMKQRHTSMCEMLKCFQDCKPTDIEFCFKLIDSIEATHVFHPSQDPRLHLSILLENLIIACPEGMQHHLLRLSLTFLNSLGFEVDIAQSHWEIKIWGFMNDEVIRVLAHLLRGCRTLNSNLCEGLSKDLKTAYTILAGEVESFDWYWGQLQLGYWDAGGKGEEKHIEGKSEEMKVTQSETQEKQEQIEDRSIEGKHEEMKESQSETQEERKKVEEKAKELRKLAEQRQKEVREMNKELMETLKEKEKLKEMLKEKDKKIKLKEEELMKMLEKVNHIKEEKKEFDGILKDMNKALSEEDLNTEKNELNTHKNENGEASSGVRK